MHRVVLFALLGMAFAVAGCVDETPVETPPAEDPTPSGSREDRLSYEVDPADPAALEGAHVHDDWGANTQMVLADLRVSTDSCTESPLVDVFYLMGGLMRDREVHKGCATFRFDSQKVVPEGTARLLVEIDATDAIVDGGMRLLYGNAEVRQQRLEATTDPVHTWTIEMGPEEWDLPHSIETEWNFLLQPTGTVGILDGVVAVFIVAEKDEDWDPVLGAAHPDHWTEKARHDFIGDDVMRLLDTNETVVFPSFADRMNGVQGSEPVDLRDIVVPGTTQVTLAVQWGETEGCPPAHGCWVVAWLSAPGGNGRGGGGGGGFFRNPVAEGNDWAIYVYDVPEPLAPDSTYANESVYRVSAFIRSCPNGATLPVPLPFLNGCMGEAFSTMSAPARFEVEAWRDVADLAALKERLGFD